MRFASELVGLALVCGPVLFTGCHSGFSEGVRATIEPDSSLAEVQFYMLGRCVLERPLTDEVRSLVGKGKSASARRFIVVRSGLEVHVVKIPDGTPGLVPPELQARDSIQPERVAVSFEPGTFIYFRRGWDNQYYAETRTHEEPDTRVGVDFYNLESMKQLEYERVSGQCRLGVSKKSVHSESRDSDKLGGRLFE